MSALFSIHFPPAPAAHAGAPDPLDNPEVLKALGITAAHADQIRRDNQAKLASHPSLNTEHLAPAPSILVNHPKAQASGLSLESLDHIAHTAAHAAQSVGHIASKTGSDLYHAALNTPAGLVHIGEAEAGSVKESVEHPIVPWPTFKEMWEHPLRPIPNTANTPATTALVKGLEDSTLQSVEHPLQHPGYTLLNALAAADMGAGLGLRASAAVDAAKTGSLGAAAKAALAPIDRGERTLRSGDLEVHPETSRSNAGAAAQKAVDSILQRSADNDPTGAGASLLNRRIAKTITAEGRAAERSAKAAPEALLRLGRSLDPGEQKALQVVAEQAPLSARVATTASRIVDATDDATRARHEDELGLLSEAAPHLTEIDGKPTFADASSPKLTKAYNLMEQVAGDRETLLRSLDLLSDESIQNRTAGAARVSVGQPVRPPDETPPDIPGQLSLVPSPAHDLFTPNENAIRIPDVATKAGTKVLSKSPTLGSQGTIGHLREPGSVTHEYTGVLRENALRREDTAQLVAESGLEASKYRGLLHVHDLVRQAAKAAPTLPDDVAVRLDNLAGHAKTPLAVKRFLADPEEHFAKETPGRQAKLVDKARSMLFFPGEHEAGGWGIDRTLDDAAKAEFERLHAQRKIGWVPKKMLGELANPKTPLRAVVPGKAVGAVDAINNISRFAILYLKPAYAIPNLLGNVSLNLLQQGFAAPRNLAQAARIASRLSAEDYARIDANMGEGVAGAISAHGAGPLSHAVDTAAHGWSRLVDVIPRRASFLFEARRAGFKSPAQLRDLLTNPDRHEQLVKVNIQANREAIDYSNLSPAEREIVRRVIFFYPWIKGSTVYAGRLLRDKPLQSAALAAIGHQGQEWDAKKLGPLPSYLEGLIPVGHGEVLNPNSTSVLQTPAQVGAALAGIATGHISEAAQASSFYTPAMNLALAELGHTNPSTGEGYPAGMNAGKIAESALGGSLPQVTLLHNIEAARSGHGGSKLYPPSVKGAVGQFVAGGAYPREVNLADAHQLAENERLAQMSLLARHEYIITHDSVSAGMGVPPSYVIADLRWKTQLDHAIKSNQSWDERAAIIARLYDQRYDTDMSALVTNLPSEGAAKTIYDQLRGQLYPTYTQWNGEVQRILDQQTEASPVG